ncbi:NAD-dependent epimerase/dehydratase family protein [Pleomorphovibrio marinus]|uniref:NAD-dependent epimerase/dehydratase family protein n=1 Tax=Pleomorphovibrio marinus TaxID=2164132 RepID=UPI000E0A9BD4|nr:NAD-dependent epimerase/dehydratase family protein [Pleomorphovibrio marinus]
METHTILGANGNIGIHLAKILPSSSRQIRLSSRNPQKINSEDKLVPADLLKAEEVNDAILGTHVAYLVAGLPYATKTWKSQWPIVMKNVIDACAAHHAKLVFFDNMYAYDHNYVGDLHEDTPMAPSSEKGKVRAEIAQMLMEAVEKGKIQAMIVRAAGFYGPKATQSFLNISVIERMKVGKKAQWLYEKDKRQSFTYIPDAAKATAFLAQQADAWDQIWHLPTDGTFPTVQEIVNFLSKELNTSNKVQVLSPLMIQLLGAFIPVLREVKELSYQMDRDFCFHSEKLQKKYGLAPTPINSGLLECL